MMPSRMIVLASEVQTRKTSGLQGETGEEGDICQRREIHKIRRSKPGSGRAEAQFLGEVNAEVADLAQARAPQRPEPRPPFV